MNAGIANAKELHYHGLKLQGVAIAQQQLIQKVLDDHCPQGSLGDEIEALYTLCEVIRDRANQMLNAGGQE